MKNRLEFNALDEEQYRLDTFKNDLSSIRTTFIIGIILYSLFAIVDLALIQVEGIRFIYIRFFFVIPTFLIIILLSFHKSFYKIHQVIITISYIIAGLGIVIMLAMEPLNYSYYSGLFLIFAAGHLLLRLRLPYIIIGTFLIIFGYAVSAMLYIRELNPDAYLYLIFYVGVYFISIIGSVAIDRLKREKFKQVYLLRGGMVTLERDKLFMEAKTRNQQKLESIGILASGVAHEINNPINGIMNYGELILEENTEDNAVSDYAKEIIIESKRIAKIVMNLLQFSRQTEEEQAITGIDDIIKRTVALVQNIMNKDRVNLDVRMAKDMDVYISYGHEVQQVILNLLTNARDALNEKYPDYNDNKKIILAVETKVVNGENRLIIMVEDRGNGIPDEIQNNIMSPFFTTKPTDKGTGLGLSISYGIVKKHGGELTFRTKKNKYTRFKVSLPLTES